MARSSFFRCFLLAFSNLPKLIRTAFGRQSSQKEFQIPPKMIPRGPQKQHFPAFLELFISMPLSAIIALFACPGAPNSFQDAAKKHLGTDSRQKRSRHRSFATFPRKCLKMASRGGPGEGLRSTFSQPFSVLSPVGSPGEPWVTQMLPKGAKTTSLDCQHGSPGVPKRSPGGPMGRLTF